MLPPASGAEEWCYENYQNALRAFNVHHRHIDRADRHAGNAPGFDDHGDRARVTRAPAVKLVMEATQMIADAYNAYSEVQAPARLQHTDDEFCWCDPLVESDDDGEETVIHLEVIWN
jgi:hypothetical protein